MSRNNDRNLMRSFEIVLENSQKEFKEFKVTASQGGIYRNAMRRNFVLGRFGSRVLKNVTWADNWTAHVYAMISLRSLKYYKN